MRFECRECGKEFSITSGTLFASHKLPIKPYLAAIAIICNEVKGKSMLAMSRDLGLSYKAAFVLCHKMREAMAEELRGRVVGGEGKVAEIDGGYFGGYVKPANLREDRKDRRFWLNQSGKRRAVVIVRERNRRSVPAVFKSESAALSWIKTRIAPGTTVNADEAPAWNELHGRFEMKRINHQKAYSFDDACTNWAESYFSRLRRAENRTPSPHRRGLPAEIRARIARKTPDHAQELLRARRYDRHNPLTTQLQRGSRSP